MAHYLPDTLNGALALGIFTFGLTFVVMAVIAVIVAVFPVLDRLGPALSMKIEQRRAAAKAAKQAVIPPEHIAVISAAIAATVGAHRIVRIGPANHVGWQAEGRAAHHGSHALSHPGASHNQGNNHGTEVQNYSRGAGL